MPVDGVRVSKAEAEKKFFFSCRPWQQRNERKNVDDATLWEVNEIVHCKRRWLTVLSLLLKQFVECERRDESDVVKYLSFQSSPDELSLLFPQVYIALFKPLRVSRRRFKKILNCLKTVRKLKGQEIYVQEKITKVDSLSLVLSGK